jgi:hypothetical protein
VGRERWMDAQHSSRQNSEKVEFIMDGLWSQENPLSKRKIRFLNTL